MAARVISQHSITVAESFDEFVPHRHVGRQAMTQHDPGTAIAVGLAIERQPIDLNYHEKPLSALALTRANMQ
jgi:hypothetical protein